MNCGIHLRCVKLLVIAAGFFCGSYFHFAAAQGFRGGEGRGFSPPSPEDMFRRMDRNQNGQIDPDEIPGFFRDTYAKAGIDTSRPISQQQFLEASQRIREQFEQARANGDFPQFRRPDGGGSPGGFGGSPSGSRPGEPERRDGSSERDRRDGRREDRDRSEDRDRREERDRDSERRRDSSSSSTKSSKKTAKPKTRVTRDLPDDYREKDKNGDGQIGLYEWDRKAFAHFYELDRNGDGFLTADELIAAAKKTADAVKSPGSDSSATASADSKNSSVTTTTKSEAKPSDPTTTKSGSSSTTTESSSGVRAFVGLDSDHDGKLTEAEWQRSRSSRNKFEKAGVAISFPIQQAQFVELYNKVEAQ